MLRRFLLFVFLFGGGVGLLLFVTGNPSLFQLEKKDVKEVQGSGGDSGLKVKMSGRDGPSQVGQNVGVVARGPGSLVDYAAENSKNEFRLDWEDSEPRSDGTYDLIRATYIFHLRENGEGSHLKGKPKIQGTADRLNIKMQLGGGGKQSIDRESEIHAFGFVMNARGGGKDRGFALGLSAGELKGRIRSSGFSTWTPNPREKVEIRLVTQGKQFKVRGRGLKLDVDQVEGGGETKALDLRILEEIEIFDGEAKGDEPFLTAKGPLRIRRIGEDRILLEVDHQVRLKSPDGQKGVLGIRGIQGEGERFTGLLSRGFIPGVAAQELSFAWTEFRFHGKGKLQARLHVSGQELKGDHLGVAISPSGGVLELVAEGKPLLHFSDQNGLRIGTLSGAESLRWSRPGSMFLETFPGTRVAFGMGFDIWPQNVVVVSGRSVFRPTTGSLIQSVVSAEGLRLFFRDGFGRPSLFFAMAPGDVVAVGGTKEEPVSLRVSGGLAVEPLGKGFAAGLGEKGGRFFLDRGSLHLEGKGKVSVKARGSGEGAGWSFSEGGVQFSSSKGGELKAWVRMGQDQAQVRGIRQALVRTSPSKVPELRFHGRELRFDWGGVHAEGELLRLLRNEEILLKGGQRKARASRRDSQGGVQETLGDQILIRPLRMFDEWRIPVLVKGNVRTRVRGPRGKTRLSLNSDEQRFFPAPLPHFFQAELARASLGPLGVFLGKWMLGEGRIEANGNVELDFKKSESGSNLLLHCLAEEGVSTLDGSFLSLQGVGSHGLKALLEQDKKGRLVFEGKKARFISMGKKVELMGAGLIPPIFKWEGKKEGLEVIAKEGKIFFKRESAGNGSFRVPGPVTLRKIPVEANGFRLSCTQGLFARLEELDPVRPRRNPWKAPLNLARIEASGGVVAKGNGISAEGERLIYDAKTQWISLEAKRKGQVIFQAGPGLIWKSSPHLSVSLRDFEIRGGFGSLEGANSSGGLMELRR